MLVDEKIRMAVTCNPNHAVVKILNPAVDDFAIPQLYLNADLTITQRTQVERLPGQYLQAEVSSSGVGVTMGDSYVDCSGTHA